MKAVILAGGLGTRLSEETHLRPKPMVEIGGRPILWHIMKIYSCAGINDFVICCGYKGYMIKEFFSNYFLHSSDVSIDLTKNETTYINKKVEPWRITLIDTGDGTMTGGRLKRVAEFIGEEENFCVTYGDGVSDVNIGDVVKFHEKHGEIATVVAVNPPGRFGAISIENDTVKDFSEKPIGDKNFINGGFFVFSPKLFSYIDGDHSILEKEPLTNLVAGGHLKVFKHSGFWQPMDTLRDKKILEDLWNSSKAPWKKW